MWTKGQLVKEAYGELALAHYVFDLSSEELQAGLTRLESMMATWAARGMTLPYAFSEDGDLDAPSGLPMVANEAVFMALAQRIAASKGKALSPTTNATARDAYSALASWVAHQDLQEQQLRAGTPRGAGQKSWRSTQQPFFNTPDTSPVQGSDSGGLTLPGI